MTARPGGGDGEHQAAVDRPRVGEPLDRLDDDPGGDREEREAVDEGGEHREPVEAVGAFASAGRRATRKASQAMASAAKSVSMCPASAISASEPEIRPPATSTSMKPPVSSAAMPMARALASPWCVVMVVAVAVAVVVVAASTGDRRGDERVEVLRVAHRLDLGGLDGDAPALGDRRVARQAVRHQRAEAVADEGVGVDGVGREAGLGQVVAPELGQEVLGVVHRLRRAVEAGGELVEVLLGAAEPDRQRGAGEVGEHRVGRVVRVDDLAERAGGVGRRSGRSRRCPRPWR